MKSRLKNSGSVFLMTVFVIALLAVLTMGILQMSTEEIQLMQNQVYATQAIAVAEAGLNDAFAQIRASSSWTPNASYTDKPFLGYGTYTVTYAPPDPNIISEGTTSQGFVARVKAEITIGGTNPPGYVIRIDKLRINE
jgi:hypothetical protein